MQYITYLSLNILAFIDVLNLRHYLGIKRKHTNEGTNILIKRNNNNHQVIQCHRCLYNVYTFTNNCTCQEQYSIGPYIM